MAQSKEKLEAKKAREAQSKEMESVPVQLKWFTWEGITSEIKKIRWATPKELLTDTEKVLLFCILFGIYFVLCDLIIARFLLLIGVGA